MAGNENTSFKRLIGLSEDRVGVTDPAGKSDLRPAMSEAEDNSMELFSSEMANSSVEGVVTGWT
jgi:hypothetical protein